MQVALLGPLRLSAEDGSTIELGGARLRMLLARLALDAGRVVPTDALIDGLWGEAPPSDATNALQSLVSRLRRTLRAGNGTMLESHPAGYRLAVTRDDVDVHRFEQLAARGHDALKAGQPAAAATSLRDGLRLWRGPAMVDLADAPFAGTAAARLAELHASAVEDRIEADILLGRHQQVLAELRTLLSEQPLRERLAMLLIKALYLSDRQADALAVYERTRRALADELGVEPSAELRRIHLAVLRRDPALVPHHPTGKETRLPARLTSFVGRRHELREVADRLAAGRFITLVGPGGAGKTRLATEVAATLDTTGGTCWFVELAGVGESADVATAVLTAVGLREIRVLESRSAAQRPIEPLERLVEALAGQRCLLVLDNCEHLITAAAALADTLLSGCPELRILATSREPLAITGEAVYPVGPLEPKEAERLFVDRAGSARPGFALDEHNQPTVTEICRRLDGLPLALELAAARLRSMTLGQIAERLDDRFRLLTAGSRTSLPRHRTLRAVVEWSWDLLEKPERILARRLSVFAAGATVESAAAVCSSDELGADDVLYVLSSLVEKSLVEAGQSRDGQPRYRMLETVRAYAAERLAEGGEDERVRTAFSRHFLTLAEQTEPRLRGPDQVTTLARWTAEQDNIIAAVRHAADAGDADTAVRLTMATAWFWMLSGRAREALELANRVIEVPGPAPEHARAALRAFATFTPGEGGMPDRTRLRPLRAELATSDAMLHYPIMAMLEPMLAAFDGDHATAKAGLVRGFTHPDPWGRAIARLGAAFLAENGGDPEEAERMALDALHRFRDLGDRWGQAMALGQLSERRSVRADHAGAVAAYEESIRLVTELGALDDMPELLIRLAGQRQRANDLDGADRTLAEALAIARDRGSAEALALCARALLLRRRGDLAAAREHLERSAAGMRGMGNPAGHWQALVECARAAIEVTAGDAEAAIAALARAFTAMLELPDMPVVAMICEGAAFVTELRGDLAGAARLIGQATAIRGAPDLGNAENAELIDRLVEALGEPGYRSAHDRGAALSRDAAIEELRAVLGA